MLFEWTTQHRTGSAAAHRSAALQAGTKSVALSTRSILKAEAML
jgi:hypothetical protein